MGTTRVQLWACKAHVDQAHITLLELVEAAPDDVDAEALETIMNDLVKVALALVALKAAC